jgi:signal transduction histidine kinase
LDARHPPLNVVTQKPRIIDLDPSRRLPPALSAVLRRRYGYAVLAPAVSGHVLVGLLVFSRREEHPLGLPELNLLTVAAEALGISIRVQDLCARTEQSAAVLQSAYAVSRAITRSLDLERTFREVATSAARSVGGAHCLLLELDQETGEFVTVATSEPDDELIGLRLRFERVKRPVDMLRERKSIVVDDLVWGAGLKAELRDRLRFQTALFLPMFAQNELIGSLVLYATGRRSRFTPDEVALAEEVAEQAAIAIHNARLYRNLARSQKRVESLLSKMAEIREHERQRFANLVHDDIVQSVVGSLYQLEALSDAVQPEAKGQFEEAVSVLRKSITDARRIIWELRPPVLEELGLAASLRALAGRTGSEGGVHVGVRVNDIPGLSDGEATALYKIAREALLNARRHSRADKIGLSLWEEGSDGRSVHLRVEDNGVGFDRATTQFADHYGLAMMEEQAALLGGTLVIESIPLQGTVVEASIPRRA